MINGEVAEWLKAHAWKACKRETVSGVRIPSSPHNKLINHCLSIIYKGFLFYVVRFVVVLELKHRVYSSSSLLAKSLIFILIGSISSISSYAFFLPIA